MPLLDRHGIKTDSYVQGTAGAEDAALLVPFDQLSAALALRPHRSKIGVAIANDVDPGRLLPFLRSLDLIAVAFPEFGDGRGFSIARTLRDAGFGGTLRATGQLIPDTFAFALRAGFDEVEIDRDRLDRQGEEQWLSALSAFDISYQRATGLAAIADRRREQWIAEGRSVVGRVAGNTPEQRLESLRRALRGRIVLTTSFGLEDQALSHIIWTEGLDIDVVTLDTGRLFPSTYQLWADTEAAYGVRIRSYHPNCEALAALVEERGVNGFYSSRPARLACCGVRKVDSLRRALAGADGWVTGLRADQSDTRSTVALAAWDEGHGLVKSAPLFDWPREAVESFCAAQGVPVNPLHAEGYLSIGCEPCTRAVRPGEQERSGRWWWEADGSRECGLHVDQRGRLVRERTP